MEAINSSPGRNLELQMMLIDKPELKDDLTTISPNKVVIFDDPLNREMDVKFSKLIRSLD